jgi:hypothetical protein
MKWRRGHIGKFWNQDYKNFPYVRQPITDEEVHEWRSKGYDYVKSFTGTMYDNRNPMPEWVNRFNNLFETYKNFTFTFYKMSTLEIMPAHIDYYKTYMRLFDTEYKDVVRILVMLEDWKPGHYLEVDGIGYTNWIAGDYFLWESDVPHMAANIGTEDRYTLQITASKIKSEDVWTKLHWYNIPDLPNKKETNSEFLKHRILPILNYNNQNPLFIYMYNSNIKELDNITHDEETIKYLNDKGIDFYLYEPLSSYLYNPYNTHQNHKHNMVFYSEFLGTEDSSHLRADELDSIQSYITRNKLTNVNVHTCDYNVEKFYPYYSKEMKLLTNDLFLKSVIPFKVDNPDYSNNFTKKFICLNWRYAYHRHYVAMYLSRLSTHLSWYFRSDFSNIHKNNWTDLILATNKYPNIFKKLLEGLTILNTHSPFNLDLNIKESVNITNDHQSQQLNPNNTTIYEVKSDGENNSIETFYNDVFCDIVNETRFAQPTANYSEKTYQPMFYKKPFVLVAPPYTLKYLKEQGFKTFSDFWDESYDTIENHEERLFKIFEVIDSIDSKSIEELQEIYIQMIPILEHNYNLVKEKIYPVRD